MLGRLGEDVPLVADVSHYRHHELFAYRVYRRIRHLCEQLVEAVEEPEAIPTPKARQRRVVAHRPDRLQTCLGHRTQYALRVLEGVSERPLVGGERFAADQVRRDDFGEEPRDRNVVLVQPAAVGPTPGVERLELRVLHDAVFAEVEPDDRAGLDAPMARDVVRRYVQHARLGREHEEPVSGERPPRGSESVAVERRAKPRAVRERDGRRAVPRLHQRRVVLVEGPDVVPDVVLRAPCLRNQHHHRVRGVASGGDKKLEDVVERGRVALLSVHEREYLREVILASRRQRQRRLARGEGVQVALYRVDLAVVRDHPERMRELPRRERVRRVALMHDRERRHEVGVGEVGVELLYLRRKKKPLVDDSARRARADVCVLRRLLDPPPEDIELPFEVMFVFNAETRRGRDEHLPDPRHDLAGVVADRFRVRRHVAPRQDFAPLRPDDLLDLRFLAISSKNHGNPKLAIPPKNLCASEPLSLCVKTLPQDPPEEPLWDSHEEARTVAGVGVVPRRTAVHEPLEYRHPLHDDFVARLAGEIRDHPDAACVVLVFAAV